MLAVMLLLPKLLLPCVSRLAIVIMLRLAFLTSLFLTLWSIANFMTVISLSFRVMIRSSPPICAFLLIPALLSLMLRSNWRTVLYTIFVFLCRSLTLFVATLSFAKPVRLSSAVLSLLWSMVMMMRRPKPNPYVGCTVTFPEPWVAIRRPGVRLCLADPVEVVTSTSHYCIPVYTLSVDNELTKNVKAYAHYFHTIRGCNAPDIAVSYLTIPRFMLALRVDTTFRALVLTSPLRVVEG